MLPTSRWLRIEHIHTTEQPARLQQLKQLKAAVCRNVGPDVDAVVPPGDSAHRHSIHQKRNVPSAVRSC
jgi:hypothetical protein